jgi:hypothetical protein
MYGWKGGYQCFSLTHRVTVLCPDRGEFFFHFFSPFFSLESEDRGGNMVLEKKKEESVVVRGKYIVLVVG